MKPLRLLLPAMLAAVGVFLLIGCIYIPTFNAVKQGENYSKKVGDAKSRKPVRVGKSTLQDVLRVLGKPAASASGDAALAYTWTVQTGVAVWPLCFHADALKGYRTLVLRFDAEGRLASYQILKADTPLLDFGGTHQPMPQDFGNPDQSQNVRPQTSPTTQRSP